MVFPSPLVTLSNSVIDAQTIITARSVNSCRSIEEEFFLLSCHFLGELLEFSIGHVYAILF